MKEKKNPKLGVGIVFLSFDVLFLADLYINVAILKFDLRAREMDQPLRVLAVLAKDQSWAAGIGL